MKQLFAIGVALAMSLGAADFSYVERVEVTGGSMKKFMTMFGGSKPITETVSVSGGKMSSKDGDSNSIIDADAGTMTAVDYKKKEYSVITFEEMKAAMAKMGEMMQQQQSKPDAPKIKTDMKVTANEKGAGPTVVGIPTKMFEINIETVNKIEGKDDKGQQQQLNMSTSMKSDVAMGKVPGSQAVREFGKRLAEKQFMQPGPMMQAMAQSGISIDMANEGMKKMAEMDGLPLRTVMQLLGQGLGIAGMPKINTGDIVSGALGGFGGFGKKKKAEEPPPPSGPPAPSVMLETTTEVQSFSSAAVDSALFVVPAGFKQVEHPMKKMLNKK